MELIKVISNDFFLTVVLLCLFLDDIHVMFLESFWHWIRNLIISLVFNSRNLMMSD